MVYDVCVVGAGLSGVSAAIAAAENGSRVLLLSLGKTLSGSSFFPGSWGLGLIGPKNDADQDSLFNKILEVGCNMVDENLARTLVESIAGEMSRLESWGIEFRMPEGNGTDRTLIPCFDDQYRTWRGLLYPSMTAVFQKKIADLGIQTLSGEAAVELLKKDGAICGLVSINHENQLRQIGCKAVVLASGGMASLFQHKIPTDDISGLGQVLALRAGASLQNLEFMQFIPAYMSPAYQTIFNERTFRFARFKNAGQGAKDAQGALDEKPLFDQAILDSRSGHGPFSCRLPGKVVDFMLFNSYQKSEGQGSELYFDAAVRQDDAGMMIKDYFAWLEKTKGITSEMPVKIAPFFHASNGGIKIDTNAATSVAGLFACGECSSGMHGADRIGGLSTANGLVFGRRAGNSAAQHAKQACAVPSFSTEHSGANNAVVKNCSEERKQLKKLMYDNATIVRTKAGLEKALGEVKNLRSSVPAPYGRDLALFDGQTLLAQAMLLAMLERAESRGSHYRADFPEQLQSQESRIVVSLADKKLNLHR